MQTLSYNGNILTFYRVCYNIAEDAFREACLYMTPKEIAGWHACFTSIHNSFRNCNLTQAMSNLEYVYRQLKLIAAAGDS
jgi:hypothetical protein